MNVLVQHFTGSWILIRFQKILIWSLESILVFNENVTVDNAGWQVLSEAAYLEE
jgi:hypothetical protein